MQTEPFEAYRSLLFAMAYRMMGSAMEAEDIVQEAYLHYRAAPPDSIGALKSYLMTIVHHLCLDHLKSAKSQRENYIGPWLPEPIITGDSASPTSPLSQLTERESISMAFLVLLESLSPLERAVFLLREVFEYEYSEIAQITGREETACRQLFSRAKKRLVEHRPRFPASPEAHAKMVGKFMEACLAGDIGGLTSLLAEDVTAWSDGGGMIAGAPRYPIQGRDKVARTMISLLGQAPQGTSFQVVEANGLPALLVRFRGQIFSVLTLQVEGNFICALRNIANPHKLAHLHLPPTSGQEWRAAP